MIVIGLQIDNFMRIETVELDGLGPGAVVVGGQNEAGKSSVLGAIWSAIQNRTGGVAVPIRTGEEQARVHLDLGEITVTRTWRGAKTTSLVVKSAAGVDIPSPQAMLDGLIGELSFDPLTFMRADRKDRVQMLLAVADLGEFTPDVQARLDADEQVAFDARTQAKRDLARLEARLAGLGKAPDPPYLEVQSSADLLAKLSLGRDLFDTSERLKAERVKLLQRLDEIDAHLATHPAPTPEQLVALETTLADLDERNNLARTQAAYRELSTEVTQTRALVAGLEDRVERCRAYRKAKLAEAKMPVPGLSFTSEGVFLDGLPLEQASSARQLRVSMAMAMAADPKLRVVHIRDASLLDDEGLRVVSDMAAKHGFQVWCERVGVGPEVTVLIEDGRQVEREKE